MKGIRLRTFALTAMVVLFGAACGGGGVGGGGGAEELAADQTLRFPITNDVGDTDPAQMSAAADVLIFRNVFSGLYKLDDQLNEVPDIADGKPDISSDGLTYTFRLKKNVKFSNGDPVKADDFIFSWNRAAARQGDYATVFEPVKGYDDVAGGKAKTMVGLTKKDDYTFSATLSAAAGYWFTEVALWTAWVVDQKVVQSAGEDTWYTKPETLIGTGPFKMSARTPKQSLDFEPVAGWWGGSTGALKKLHVDVIEDQSSQVKKYEQGGYDLIGYGDNAVPAEDILRIQAGTHKNELHLIPQARTDWIGFNFEKGPFAGDAGKDGRKAFSLAIDRKQLADIACAKGTICTPATGGVVSKGLKGYLGDNADPNTKFDAAAAKTLYQKWDPDGSKVKGLKYTFNTLSLNKAVAENLQSQWQANLGVKVDLEPLDRQSFFKARTKKSFVIFRHSWGADYDHPQDWYDFLFVTNAGSGGSGYSNKKFDALVKQANQKPLDQAIADYNTAGKMLTEDVTYGGLFYALHRFIWKPYMRGVGTNALYDYYWSEAKILKH